MNEQTSLPTGWTTCQLGDLVSIIRGVSYTKDECFDTPSASLVPLLRATNLGEGITFDDLVHVSATCVGEHQLLACGDIVIAASSGSISVVGKAARLDRAWRGSFGAFCMCVRPCDDVDSEFLNYFMQTAEYRNTVSSLAKGSNINNLRREHIQTISFRLPPNSEQRRIAHRLRTVLGDIETGVAALNRAKSNLDRYRESVLQSAVTGALTAEWRKANPAKENGKALLDRILRERRERWEKEQLASFAAKGKQPPKGWQEKYEEPPAPDTTQLPELPEGWVWASIDQLLASLRNGYFASPCPGSEGTPILRINAVRPMRVDLEEVRHLDVTPESDPIADFFIENGDLLFTRYNGSMDFVGVAGMVRKCTTKILHPDKLIRVVLLQKGSHPAFVEICANTGSSRRHILSKARTTAGQTGISGADIRQMPIPLPSLEEQDRIASVVSDRLQELLRAQEALDEQIAHAGALRQCILKAAFEGRLVPQDPNDEPAPALLERIKAKASAAIATKTKITKRRKAAAK